MKRTSMSLQSLLLWCVSAVLLPVPICTSAGEIDTLTRKALSLLEDKLGGYEEELLEFAAIPTVSALPEHQKDIELAAAWLIQRLGRAGLQNAKRMETGAQPVVYADWKHAGENTPTVLLYAHFDVQPADPLELWDTPPFEPVLDREAGMFRGRGVSDDKQGVMAIIHSLELMMEAGNGTLPVNVKLLLEGQEELLSPNLEEFISKTADVFACDYAFSADGGQISEDQPGLQLGMRGMVAVQLEARTAAMDLHSGTYGGSLQNANHAMAQLLASLHADDGSVAVKGFYEGVSPPSEADREDIAAFPFDEAAELRGLRVVETVGEEGYGTLERRWLRPTLEIVGMWGGFTGAGLKTVLPAASWAKLSCRIVPGQSPDDIVSKIRKHVELYCPKGTEVSVSVLGRGSYPFVSSRSSPAVKVASSILKEVMGREPLVCKAGSSIPALALMQRYLNVQPVPFGFTLSNHDLLHSPNERFKASMYRTAHVAYVKLMYAMSGVSKPAAVTRDEL